MAERQRRQPGKAVLAAGLLVCACATACSGAGLAAEDARAAHDPVRTVRQASGALLAAGSSQARTAMEMATGGTRVTIRGEGDYDFRRQLGRLTLVLPQDPTGAPEHRPITELLAPGALFMKNRGAGVPADKWVRVETATLSDGNLVTGGATDPLAAADLLRGARDVVLVGRETLPDGTRVSHYRGTADIARAARAAPAAGRGPLEAAARGFARTRVPFDAWLDAAGRLRKLSQTFMFSAAGAGPRTARAVTVVSTTLYDGFGVPVPLSMPRPADIWPGKIVSAPGGQGSSPVGQR
jgi:hypothetical protein